MAREGWDNEAAAADTVSAYVEVDSIVKRDVPGAPAKTHDFDLHVGDRIVALEVTSTSDQRDRQFWSEVGDNFWDEPSLSGSWLLTLRPGTHIKSVRAEVATHLRFLERLCVWQFSESQSPPLFSTLGER